MELISDGSISNHITKKIYQFSFEFFLPKLFPNNSNLCWVSLPQPNLQLEIVQQ